MCNNDAVLWKREEKVGFDHKMLWFGGKNWAEKWLVFARFFCPFLKMHSTRLRACTGKKVVLGVIWRNRIICKKQRWRDNGGRSSLLFKIIE